MDSSGLNEFDTMKSSTIPRAAILFPFTSLFCVRRNKYGGVIYRTAYRVSTPIQLFFFIVTHPREFALICRISLSGAVCFAMYTCSSCSPHIYCMCIFMYSRVENIYAIQKIRPAQMRWSKSLALLCHSAVNMNVECGILIHKTLGSEPNRVYPCSQRVCSIGHTAHAQLKKTHRTPHLCIHQAWILLLLSLLLLWFIYSVRGH